MQILHRTSDTGGRPAVVYNLDVVISVVVLNAAPDSSGALKSIYQGFLGSCPTFDLLPCSSLMPIAPVSARSALRGSSTGQAGSTPFPRW